MDRAPTAREPVLESEVGQILRSWSTWAPEDGIPVVYMELVPGAWLPLGTLSIRATCSDDSRGDDAYAGNAELALILQPAGFGLGPMQSGRGYGGDYTVACSTGRNSRFGFIRDEPWASCSTGGVMRSSTTHTSSEP